MTFSTRPVVVFDIPLKSDVLILHPEAAIIRFPHGKTVDIGALCYLRREPTALNRQGQRKRNAGRKVDLSSFYPERVECVRALITHFSENLEHSGRRAETVRDYATRFFAFMSWADNCGYHNVLRDVSAAQETIRNYAHYIRERVQTNSIATNSGVHQQTKVFTLLEEFFEVEGLTRGINLLRANPASKEHTAPPSEDDQAKALSLYEAVFSGLSALAMGESSYPYALVLPPWVGYHHDMVWVFPSISWFMSPSMLSQRDSLWCPAWCFNYAEGRLNTLDELRAVPNFAGDSDNRRRQALRKAKQQLERANDNLYHSQRNHNGLVALNSFILLFVAQTGMNWAQVVELSWSDDYEVSTTHQNFRTVKWRAGGKKVSFELPTTFMPKFKRFLKLRSHLLNGRECHWLFFRLGTKGVGAPTQIKTGPTSTYQTLRRLAPNLAAVMPKQWRAAKSDWLVRHTDPSTTALVLQNSERTVLASYAEGSEMTHLSEMSKFLNSVSATVLNKDQIVEGGTNRAVGVCSKFGEPNFIAPNSPMKPDCKGSEGCLFCDKFKLHADETDVRKLISCRYYLQQTETLASSSDRLIASIFDRIEEILLEVSRRDAGLVRKVAEEVAEGELDTYWARKLEMLMELGVVA